jgi:hypothetical protein
VARTLKGSIKAAMGLTYLGDIDLGNNKALLPFADELVIGSGTGNGQANLAWWDHRSLAASTTEDLDFSGALVDPLGGTAVFTKIKGIYVKAKSTNGGNIEVGGDAASVPFLKAVNDIVVLAPGQAFLITNLNAGWTVTATTADIIQVANTDGAAAGEYDIAVIGLS